MVDEPSLVSLARQVTEVLDGRIAGDLVECGVWRGGSAFLMAGLLRRRGVRDRRVWLFDSFAGLPPPEEIDGPKAIAYARDVASPGYFENCRADLNGVEAAVAGLGLGAYVRIVKGWFEQTLPEFRERVGPISVLRVDADWYSSVRCCLENLFDQVSAGGFIVLDDYFTWDGCAVAVHEFLGARRLAYRIERSGSVAFLRKAGSA
jgi:O-methyltransferase